MATKYEFYFNLIEGKPKKEQMFKLLKVKEKKKKKHFAEVSDPENKKLVDNSIQGNTQKSKKKVGMI